MTKGFHFARYGKTRYWAVMDGPELLGVALYRKGAAALVALLQRLQPTGEAGMKTPDTAEAWRFCDPGKLTDPATVQALVQAALGTFLAVRYARRFIDPAEIGTHVDWAAIERELQAALSAAGHPAGDTGGGP